ncbi:predicted protein [Naegleria gruberi]|uniref:Predicted protein n=1 Tax=Naegleria gruberi TaxID=5762 RepID=D2VY09_NAEGR|nr:uncharacterized protein NAEGRDRAFT_53145 [Naegleria gruberi]EFC38240.1 predicted protein [Naegleria gruberi]|eukprot:XP_002670984.1 predicted protein [Naegleria gruberi strain NEG-M]
MLPSLSDLFGQDDGKDANKMPKQQQLTISNPSSTNNNSINNNMMFVGQQHHHAILANSNNGLQQDIAMHHVHGSSNVNAFDEASTSKFQNSVANYHHQFVPSTRTTLDSVGRSSQSFTAGSNNNSSNLKSNLTPALIHATSCTPNMMFSKIVNNSGMPTSTSLSMHGSMHSTHQQQVHEMSKNNDACLHVFDTKTTPLPNFSTTTTTTASNINGSNHSNTNGNPPPSSSLNYKTQDAILPNNLSPPTTNSSQQMYFSNPIQYSPQANQLHASNNNLNNRGQNNGNNNDQTAMHDYQPSSSAYIYERNSPILLQNEVYNNGNVSSSSSTNNTARNSSTKSNVNDTSTNVVNTSQNGSFPSRFENYQHHDLQSSTHPVIKENHLNTIFNGIFYEDAENSKRKIEDASNSSRKKRKNENETKHSINNSESFINPPSIITTPKSLNRQSNTTNSSSKKTKSEINNTKQPLKSPSGLSDSSTNYATHNSLSTVPQNSIQFMNFSISDKSKIKFVNARHQQIGINDGAWTEKEHADFMRGLNECGRGRWREIAENYVLTRTRTQVASHARKYLETPPNKKGRNPGVYLKWDDCKEQVQGFSGNCYKKFSSIIFADWFVEEGPKKFKKRIRFHSKDWVSSGSEVEDCYYDDDLSDANDDREVYVCGKQFRKRRKNIGDEANDCSHAPVCRYHLEGNCRFGRNCRFYHPPRSVITRMKSNSEGNRHHPNDDQ